MDREQQDRLWSELSENKRTHLKSMFVDTQDEDDKYANGYLNALIDMFGSHNLNSKPSTPKTWEDIIANLPNVKEDYCSNVFENYVLVRNVVPCSDKIKQKLESTYRIAKLIELGYGGLMTEEEWNDESVPKECIVPVSPKGFEYTTCRYYSDKAYIAFHSIEQLIEFMSHESNKKLVKQYYMM